MGDKKTSDRQSTHITPPFLPEPKKEAGHVQEIEPYECRRHLPQQRSKDTPRRADLNGWASSRQAFLQ